MRRPKMAICKNNVCALRRIVLQRVLSQLVGVVLDGCGVLVSLGSQVSIVHLLDRESGEGKALAEPGVTGVAGALWLVIVRGCHETLQILV